MKPFTIFTSLLLLLLTSCNSATDSTNNATAIPKALEEKTASYDVISKRGSDDLLEDLVVV